MDVILEKLVDPERFARLRDEWNQVLEASHANCIFLTWEWLHTWWKHLADGRRLFILTVRHGGRLVAIAPLALRRRRLTRFMPFRALEFLGMGSIGSDYLDVIARRGMETEAVRALADSLAPGKHMLELTAFNKEEPCTVPALAGQLRERHWTSWETTFDICPYINLSEHSWPSYLATLSWEHRHNFKRRLRQLTKQFTVSFEPAESEAQRREALEALLALHVMRWWRRGGSNAFHTHRIHAFHEELSRLALQRGWLRLFLLRLDDQLAGALYGFMYNHRFYFYQQGFDARYARYSPGLVMTGLTIEAAIKEGAEEYDFLRGDEEFKFHWTADARELGRLELYPPGARGLLCSRAMGVRRVATSIGRRLLSKQPT
jgi:CelD/BcsL family acetyltransferase involved in cellulose biosynthesis